MSKYEHELAIRFTMRSNDPGGEDLTLDRVRKAVARRFAYLTMLSRNGLEDWKNAVLPPVTTNRLWMDETDQITVEIVPPRTRLKNWWKRKS